MLFLLMARILHLEVSDLRRVEELDIMIVSRAGCISYSNFQDEQLEKFIIYKIIFDKDIMFSPSLDFFSFQK